MGPINPDGLEEGSDPPQVSVVTGGRWKDCGHDVRHLTSHVSVVSSPTPRFRRIEKYTRDQGCAEPPET